MIPVGVCCQSNSCTNVNSNLYSHSLSRTVTTFILIRNVPEIKYVMDTACIIYFVCEPGNKILHSFV